MIGNTKERWRELCEQASVEQDPDKLLELVREINQLLDEKRTRLADKTKKQFRFRARNKALSRVTSHPESRCHG